MVCDIDMVLAPHHPSTIILKGWLNYISKQDQGYFLHTFFHNCFQNIIFYEPYFFHFRCVHVMVGNVMVNLHTNQSIQCPLIPFV